MSEKKTKRGPEPERLKIESDEWEDAMRQAVHKLKDEPEQEVTSDDADDSQEDS